MTFKPARLLLALLAVAAAPAFAQVAVVNGKTIPNARMEELVKQITSQPNAPQDSPDLRLKIKEELIAREIFIQEADKLKLDKDADVKTQMEIARQTILIRALVNDFKNKHPVSDTEINTEYQKAKAQAGDTEYHVRHILLGTQEEANAVIAKLKAGASFEELAKQSKDPGSASNGGDLDWATPVTFVKPFSDAMVSLKKGQMTETPVQTQFGWHIIKLDDTRPTKFPTLDEIKKQIAENLEQMKFVEYQKQLRAKAVVK